MSIRRVKTNRRRVGKPLSAESKRDRYDYEAAKAAGIKPDKSGHYPSRIAKGPNRGLILKLEGHPTINKTLAAEDRLGFTVRRGTGGRLFSARNKKKAK